MIKQVLQDGFTELITQQNLDEDEFILDPEGVCSECDFSSNLSSFDKASGEGYTNTLYDADLDTGRLPVIGGGNPGSQLSPSSRTLARRLRQPYIQLVAMEIKASRGLLKKSEANDLMLTRMITDKMTEHGVRPTHIARSVPLCLVLIYTPLNEDIEARQFEKSDAVQRQHNLYNAPWWSFWSFWTTTTAVP